MCIYYENVLVFGSLKGTTRMPPSSFKPVAILRSTNQYQTTSQLCVFCDAWSRLRLRDETSLKIVTEIVFLLSIENVSTKFRYKSIELMYARRSLLYISANLTDKNPCFM